MFSQEVERLLGPLFEPNVELPRGHDPRRDCLKALSASGEFRVVPLLLPLLAANDSLTEDAARAVEQLLRGIEPAQLAWVDEHARMYSYEYGRRDDAWRNLWPDKVPALGRALEKYPTALGLLASSRSGFVREAVVNELARVMDGREIPFLALRANDWVDSVAERAGELLAARVRPDNRRVVLDALPFLARMVRQRRRDHGRFLEALRIVFASDDYRDLLARVAAYDLRVRRFVFDLLQVEPPAIDSVVIRAALADIDAVVRTRAIRQLSAIGNTEGLFETLDELLSDDPMPSVRKETLTVLAQRVPDRLADLLPRVLLDRAASVRDLARFLVRDRKAAIVPRELYIEILNSNATAAAIDGLGETGMSADVDLVIPLLAASLPRVRRSALRAIARLDGARGIPAAMAALQDVAPSVRTSAAMILVKNAHRVDFAAVSDRLRGLTDARAREAVLPLLKEASKWDAAAFLLQALTDSDAGVRGKAAHLLNLWVADFNRTQIQPTALQLQRVRTLLGSHASRMPKETVDALQFIVRTH